MSIYIPSRWYWIVAGLQTQVFSSAATAYVPATDPTYVAWLAAGNAPSRIALEGDLWDLLVDAGLPLPVGAATSDVAKTARISDTDMVLLQVLFNHENRIRVLEGKAAVTVAQFKTAIKTLLP